MDEQSEPIDYARLCHLAEVAEAHIERMNDQIRFAFDVGLAVEGALPPRVVNIKPYDRAAAPRTRGK